VTSPNGNHYVTPFESYCSDSEDEVLPTNRKYEAVPHALASNNSAKIFSSNNGMRSDADLYSKRQQAPIRIAKNGDYVAIPVSRIEQHVRSTSSDDDDTTTSLLPHISVSNFP